MIAGWHGTDTRDAGHLPVSAVVPCYRCAATVRRAVASIAGQTSRPAQVILVDDGSRDDTVDVLRDLRRSYGESWVTVVALDENRGAASARNSGWNIASGEYIAFLDADDAWHPRKLEIQHAFMRARPDISLCGHAHVRIAEGAPLDTPLHTPGYSAISFGQLLLSNRFITPSVMVRRDIAQRFLESARHMEDHLLWLRIAASGARVARLDETLAFIYKPQFGATGLSANLADMERAELGNYRRLREEGSISAATMWAMQAYSLAKFARRLFLAAFAS